MHFTLAINFILTIMTVNYKYLIPLKKFSLDFLTIFSTLDLYGFLFVKYLETEMLSFLLHPVNSQR